MRSINLFLISSRQDLTPTHHLLSLPLLNVSRDLVTWCVLCSGVHWQRSMLQRRTNSCCRQVRVRGVRILNYFTLLWIRYSIGAGSIDVMNVKNKQKRL